MERTNSSTLSQFFKSCARLVAALVVFATLAPAAHAQTPGSSMSASLLGGIHGSNLAGGSGTGTYMALRGSLGNYYAEVRDVHWGSKTSSTGESVNETGYLVGYKMSLLSLVVSGGLGLGNTTHRSVSTTGIASEPTSYKTLAYEAQAIYNIPIVPGVVTAGVGANIVGETSGATPVNGIGGVASVSVGF